MTPKNRRDSAPAIRHAGIMARHVVWALLLALGCGGKSQDQEIHQEQPDADTASAEHCIDCDGPGCELGAHGCQGSNERVCQEDGWHDTGVSCSNDVTACIEKTAPPEAVVPLYGVCGYCMAGSVPRCLAPSIPIGRSTEPPACAAPSCERPLGNVFIPSLYGYGPSVDLLGSCADNKTFQATLGTFQGHIIYYRNGSMVGEAAYTSEIGDCSCSGEAYGGDAACLSPTFDPPQNGELRLPFADGHRAAPCACVD